MLPSNVETPETLNLVANNVLVWVVIPGPNVETPVAFTSSNSVCPSTSKSTFASMLPPNVEIPDTFKSSSSV